MAELRHILCPTDFSDSSRAAMARAAVLAQRSGAAITLLHVYPPPAAAGGLAVGYFPEDLDAATRSRLIEALSLLAEPASKDGVPVHTLLLAGDPAKKAVSHAREVGADLIVMGTRGSPGGERPVLGSAAERVVREAPCSVLTVPDASEASLRPRGFQIVLCPLDLSDTSAATLAQAISLVHGSSARLLLQHTYATHWEDAWLVAPPVDDEFRRLAVDEGQRRLRALLPPEAPPQVGTLIAFGKPCREILRDAQEAAADVIVIGAHGGTAIDRRFFGSTAQQVLRGATCPVLTVRPHRKRLPLERGVMVGAHQQP